MAAAVGVGVELVLSITVHRREAWDSEYYWIFGVPAMILGAFIGGLFARCAPVRIGYAPFLGQLITMVVRAGGGSRLPLGTILIGIIGLSGVLAAFVGAAIGRRLLGNSAPRIPPASGSTSN
jgi:hypothetical protein